MEVAAVSPELRGERRTSGSRNTGIEYRARVGETVIIGVRGIAYLIAAVSWVKRSECATSGSRKRPNIGCQRRVIR